MLGPSQPGRKIAIFGDTYDDSRIAALCNNATVLVHEATLSNEMATSAIEKGHSTPGRFPALTLVSLATYTQHFKNVYMLQFIFKGYSCRLAVLRIKLIAVFQSTVHDALHACDW